MIYAKSSMSAVANRDLIDGPVTWSRDTAYRCGWEVEKKGDKSLKEDVLANFDLVMSEFDREMRGH